jgi:ribonuclease P protein component
MLEAAAYGRVFKKAKRSRDNLFTVLYRDNGQRAPRLGLAISKKNCRLAVGRNRIKRIVRESFRLHQGQLPGIDIVVLNQAGTHKVNNKKLFDSLAGHWQRCAANGNRMRESA